MTSVSNLEALKMYLETLEDIQTNIESIANQGSALDDNTGDLRTAVHYLDMANGYVEQVVTNQEAAALKKWVDVFAPAADPTLPLFAPAEQVTA
jgi:hypothetical protein